MIIDHPGPWQQFHLRSDNKGLLTMELKSKYINEQYLFETQMTAIQHQYDISRNENGGGPLSTSTPSLITDPNAAAFIAATGITNPTQQVAIDNLVISLKANELWSNMNAIYPFVGGTAFTHKYNLKDPRNLSAAYPLFFGGGWVHNSNGAIGNGTNTYADTGFYDFGGGEFGVYNRGGNPYVGGLKDEWAGGDFTVYYRPHKYIYGSNFAVFNNGSDAGSSNNYINVITAPLGFFALSGNNTIARYYKNGVELGNVAPFEVPNSLGEISIWLGAINNNNAFGGTTYGDSQLAFGFISTTVLNTTQNTNLYTIVQAFQTALGRQV